MTTPVGSIRLDLTIDGSDTWAQIERQVRPVLDRILADTQRRLDAIEREQREASRAAERSAAEQVTAARRVEEAVEDVGDQHARTAERVRLSAAAQSRANNQIARSTDRVTRALDEATAAQVRNAAAPNADPTSATVLRQSASGYRALARAIDQVTEAQIRNAAAPRPDHTVPSRDRDRDSRRFGRDGGGSSGGRGGVLGFLTGPVGLNLIAQGAAAWPAILAGVTTGVMNVVGAVQQLGQSGLVLPGIFAGAAASVGTAVIGFQGIGDAVKALNDAVDDPKKLEAANKALEGLAPAAREVATSVAKLTQGPLKDFQKAIAQPMLEGVASDLEGFAGKVLPRAQAGMSKVATAWNGTLKTAMTEVGSDNSLGLMDQIFGNTAEAQTRANNAIKPFINGFGTLAKEGSYFLPRLGDALTKVSERFENFVTRNSANGNMFRWIDEGLNGVRALGNAILNIGKTLVGLTKAAGQAKGSLSGDGGLLGSLERVTKRWADFTNSTEGQLKLGKFFRDGTAELHKYRDFLKEIWPAIQRIVDGFQAWGQITFPIIKALGSVVNTLSQMPGLIEGITVAFLAWKTVGGIASLTTGLTGATAAAGTLMGRLTSVRAMLGIGAVAGGAMMAGSDSGASQLGGILMGAAGGALTGSMFGPIGALIGGAAGGGIAALNAVMQQNERANAAAADAQERYRATLAQTAAAADSMSAAQKTLNDALLASSGVIDGASIDAVAEQLTNLPKSLGGKYGESTIADMESAMAKLGLTQRQLAGQVTGSQPIFDAMLTNLRNQGVSGMMLAGELLKIRDGLLGAQHAGEVAGPVLQKVSEALGVDLPQAAANIRTAFDAVPENVPINISAPGAPAILDLLTKMGAEVVSNNEKNIAVVAPLAQSVIDALHQLGIEVTTNNDKTISVQIDQNALATASGQMSSFMDQYKTLFVTPQVTTPPVAAPAGENPAGAVILPPQHRAAGGPIWGLGPKGVDSVPILAAPGEHMWTDREVDMVGGHSKMYRLRAMARAGLLRGMDTGGAVDGTPPGLSPLASDVAGGVSAAMQPAVGLLGEIRDLLKMAPASVGGFSGGTGGGTAVFAGSSGPKVMPVGGSGLQAAIALAQKANGGKYQLGATGGQDGTVYDCSGFMSDIFAALTGKPYSGNERYFTTTSDFPSLGFQPGYDPNSAFNIGVSPEHMAGTLAGVPVESGGNGVQFGGSAHGATDPQFSKQYHLPIGMPAGLGGSGIYAPATDKQLREAQQRVSDRQYDVDRSKSLLDEANNDPKKTARQRADAQHRYDKSLRELADAQSDLAGKMRAGGGGFGGAGGAVDPKMFPYGDPRRVIAGVLGGIGVTPEDIGAIMGAAAGGPVGSVAGDVVGSIATTPLPGPLGYPGTPTAPSTDLMQLVAERNPLAVAQAAGFDVPDYSRFGGGASAQNLMVNGGPAGDPMGRMYSDTAALVDRTFTNLDAAEKARHDQVMTVLNAVKDRLGVDLLEPVVQSGVSGGMAGMADGTAAAIGAAMAPPIADAVANVAPVGMAGGGSVFGGIPGKDSVPILGMPGEHMLTVADVNAMGGQAGVYAFRQALHRTGGLRLMAKGGSVDVTDKVGGDFFGVSQVPILGALVNLLVMVLLRVIGVQVESRDTLNEISSQFREFRGEFQAFDASGRLMNDTSGLVDRTGSSEQEAADERIRILKLVLEGLIKFIIEKIIVPIGKAVANAAISIGSQMASSAISGGLGAAFPGGSVVGGAIGSVVSSAIQSGGGAAVDIIADVGSKLGTAALSVLVEGIGDLLQSALPSLTTFFFSGDFIATIADTVTGALSGLLGGVTGLFGALVGGIADLWPFDEGGIASGMGLMPKATIQPERVLSPRQTSLFEQMVRAEFGANRNPERRIEIHSPMYFQGGERTGQQVKETFAEMMR